MGKAEIQEKNVSRKSLIFLLSTLTLLAIMGLFLLFESAEGPEPAQRAGTSAKVKGAAPLTMTASGAPRPTAQPLAKAAKTPSEASQPLPDNVKNGEEGALSPTRTGVRLYGDARIKPLYNLHNHELGGVQVKNITPGSFWEELGIDEGDVILELNGDLINSPTASVNLMNQFSRGYVLNLRLRTHEGVERFIDYRTPGFP